MLTREDSSHPGLYSPLVVLTGAEWAPPHREPQRVSWSSEQWGVQSLHRVMDLNMTYVPLGVRALQGYAERGLNPSVGADSVCLPAFLTELSCSQPQHRHLRTHWKKPFVSVFWGSKLEVEITTLRNKGVTFSPNAASVVGVGAQERPPGCPDLFTMSA